MKLEHLRNKPALLKQLTLVGTLKATLEGQPSSLGAAVAGSLATDLADHMSDVDLVVYCDEGAAARTLAELSAVAQTVPTVFRLNGKHDDFSVYEKVVLEDWSSYEIHVIEPQTRMRLKSPYVEILNRGQYLETRVSEDKPIGRETARPYANGDAGLFWELFNCMKWLRRGETAFTGKYLQQLAQELAQGQRPN